MLQEAAQIQQRRIYYQYVRDCKFTNQKEKKKGVQSLCNNIWKYFMGVGREYHHPKPSISTNLLLMHF